MSTAFVEDGVNAVSVNHAHIAKYEKGEIVWTAGDDKTQEPTGRLKEDEIIYVQPSRDNDTTLIYSLSEQEDQADNPFKLSILAVAQLPEELKKYLLTQTPAHLASSSTRQLHVIISTASGVGQSQRFWDGVLQPLLDARGLKSTAAQTEHTQEHAYEVITTKSSHSVREFASRLTDATIRQHTTILLSGDGGVVDLLNSSNESSASDLDHTVALLPFGTGNALFHSLHRQHYLAKDVPTPSPLVLGLRTVFRGVVSPLPTFKASFSPGSRLVTYTDASGNMPAGTTRAEDLQEQTTAVSHLFGAIVASYGFHASLVWESDTPEYRKHGAKRFGMVAQELLKLAHPYSVRVEVRLSGTSDTEWAELTPGETFTYVVATLVSNLERTFTVSPASRPLDGQLRLVHFGDVGGERTMQIMMAAYQDGAHLDMVWRRDEGGPEKKVGYEAVEALRVNILEEDVRWRKVCIDGTIVDIPAGGWMEVKRAEVTARLKILADCLEG